MTNQSTPTISEKIDSLATDVACYFFGLMPSKYWKDAVANQHKEAMEKSRTQIISLLADFAERITPEKDTRVNAIKGVDEGIQLGFNACVDTITQNVKAELGAAPINSKEVSDE